MRGPDRPPDDDWSDGRFGPLDPAQPEPEERPQRRREWRGPLIGLGVPVLLLLVVLGFVWLIANGGIGVASGSSVAGGAVEQGKSAPDFNLHALDGTPLRLSDLRGKPVILNFWATWCGPCRQEVPRLVDAYHQHLATGLVVVGVDLQEDTPSVRSFATEFGMDYPVLLDTKGQTIRPYRITGPPTSIFIDRTGVVRGVVLGPLTDADLGHWISVIAPTNGG